MNHRGFLLYTSILKPKNKPIKAVVCHCHGYSDNPSYSRRKEMLRFVERGIALIMIDYEGHGRSDGTLGLVVDWDELVNDVSSYFKETVDTQFPNKKVFLMGESMGGAVAFCVYRKMPELFSGVNFICPMAKIADDMLPPQWVIDTVRKVAGPKGEASIFGFLPIAPSKGDLKEFSFKLASKRALLTRVPTVFGRKPRIATARELLVS
jgi:alpha-beta hydrolase superfamily lysophospholipase